MTHVRRAVRLMFALRYPYQRPTNAYQPPCQPPCQRGANAFQPPVFQPPHTPLGVGNRLFGALGPLAVPIARKEGRGQATAGDGFETQSETQQQQQTGEHDR